MDWAEIWCIGLSQYFMVGIFSKKKHLVILKNLKAPKTVFLLSYLCCVRLGPCGFGVNEIGLGWNLVCISISIYHGGSIFWRKSFWSLKNPGTLKTVFWRFFAAFGINNIGLGWNLVYRSVSIFYYGSIFWIKISFH